MSACGAPTCASFRAAPASSACNDLRSNALVMPGLHAIERSDIGLPVRGNPPLEGWDKPGRHEDARRLSPRFKAHLHCRHLVHLKVAWRGEHRRVEVRRLRAG